MVPVKIASPGDEKHIIRCLKSIRHFYPETLVIIMPSKDSLPLPEFEDNNIRIVPNKGFSTTGCLQYLHESTPDDSAFIIHDSMTVVKPIVYDTNAPIQFFYYFTQPGMANDHYHPEYAHLLTPEQHADMVRNQIIGCGSVCMYIRREAIERLNILHILPKVQGKRQHEAMERIFAYLAQKHKLLNPTPICREYLHHHMYSVPWKKDMTFEEMLDLNAEIPVLKVIVQRQ